MKQLLPLLLFTLLTISCVPIAKYEIGDKVCIEEIEVTIYKVRTSSSIRAEAEYECRYKTTVGEVITYRFYESELTKCKI